MTAELVPDRPPPGVMILQLAERMTLGEVGAQASRDVATKPDQSAGVTQWVTVTFEPGTCEARCFVPDPESGMPHDFMGMHTLFEVADQSGSIDRA